MKDIVVVEKSYNEAAKRLKELAIRNMRVLLRKTKIKRICRN
jgi:GTP cyclohydrolase II